VLSPTGAQASAAEGSRPAQQSSTGSKATPWTRRGLLLEAPKDLPWAVSHAALPTIETGEDGGLSLYYSPRDERGRAHIARARLEVAPGGELMVAERDSEPVLSPGELGAFDDAGVTVSCVVADREGEGTLLYYTGWALGVSVPFYFYAGLARRRPGERAFARVSQAPILERNEVDPYLTASPWVLREQGLWRMWYVSCARWEFEEGPQAPPRHYYHVRYAESEDGVHWRREGEVALDFKDEEEYAMGRPCVLHDGERYRMWLCARGQSYRLAYAESTDGRRWKRDDARVTLGPVAPTAAAETSPSTGAIDPEDTAAESWDAEMQAYPAIFDHGGRRYLLYNGNGYGRSGVGYATSGGGED
jgi:hypothetical protein